MRKWSHKNRESLLYRIMQMPENEVKQDRYLNLNKFAWIANNEIYNTTKIDLIELDD